MAKKSLTRTLDTSTAEGQEKALRLLQEASTLTVAQPSIPAPLIPEPALVDAVPTATQTELTPQRVAPQKMEKKKMEKPKIEKRGRPAKKEANEGSSVRFIADGSSVKRINMDFPLEMYGRIESEIDETGQTVKGFFLMLAKQYFKNRGNTPSV